MKPERIDGEHHTAFIDPETSLTSGERTWSIHRQPDGLLCASGRTRTPVVWSIVESKIRVFDENANYFIKLGRSMGEQA